MHALDTAVKDIRIIYTSFGIEFNSDDNNNHPASFSLEATVTFLLNSVSIFLETSSTDLGNL